MENLCNDVFCLIIKDLSIVTICRLARVSKRLNELVRKSGKLTSLRNRFRLPKNYCETCLDVHKYDHLEICEICQKVSCKDCCIIPCLCCKEKTSYKLECGLCDRQICSKCYFICECELVVCPGCKEFDTCKFCIRENIRIPSC